MEPIIYTPIGEPRTPLVDPKGGPIQPRGAGDAQGRAELWPELAPARPNPIGLSVVALEAVEGASLLPRGVDMLDHSPLLDLKPYVPGFDHPAGEVRTGWLGGRAGEADSARADDRFA